MVKGFTLTMWDVKAYLEQIRIAQELSFTLTMWDVKEELAEILEKSKEIVLP